MSDEHPTKTNTGSDWARRWREAARTVTCALCEKEGAVTACEKCCEDECTVYVHRACLDPLRTEWNDFAGFVCDDCDGGCVVCGDEYETDDDPLILCDECDALYHVACLDASDQPPCEEIGDETKEWLCPECADEYRSDEEWASEHVIPDDAMQREDCFTRSECPCDVCTSMNAAVASWDTFRPSNPIQRSLKEAIDSREGIVTDIMDDLHYRHGLPPPSSS